MAMSNLGGCHFFGLGVAKDPSEGLRWYKRSANVGHSFGQFNYANCKFNGHGCIKAVEEAVSFYRLAAEQNFDGASTNLGIIYQRGYDTVKEDHAESYKYFKKGASNGNIDSTNGLGCCLYQGQGVRKDVDEGKNRLQASGFRLQAFFA